MQVQSFAKINWSLRVLGKRTDGYHELETLFQTISLHDTITLTPSPHRSMTCDDGSVPCDESNLVMRAARALGAPPVAAALRKRIPPGGGLGGGSSNAAATLQTLEAMFRLGTSPERLHALALSLGSDVPFFLVGGTAYATGRGEVLTPVAPAGSIPLLLLFPEERVSTAAAFSLLRRYSTALGMSRYEEMLAGDFLGHASLLINDFEDPIFARLPKLRELRDRLSQAGADWARMTGSGSTIVGAFRSAQARDAARAAFPDVRSEAAVTINRSW